MMTDVGSEPSSGMVYKATTGWTTVADKTSIVAGGGTVGAKKLKKNIIKQRAGK